LYLHLSERIIQTGDHSLIGGQVTLKLSPQAWMAFRAQTRPSIKARLASSTRMVRGLVAELSISPLGHQKGCNENWTYAVS